MQNEKTMPTMSFDGENKFMRGLLTTAAAANSDVDADVDVDEVEKEEE